MRNPWRSLAAEGLGTAFLLAAIVGSGIMAERLAAGNVALALLCNALATGAMLVVLITIFAPLSGAHFNPAVTLAMAVRREIAPGAALAYVAVQIGGAILGTWLAHAMFDQAVLQLSTTGRNGMALCLAEGVATFGLILTILGALRYRPEMIAASVGLYIFAAYWFTASTSFANPAVTIARALTDSFAGIAPQDAPGFIAAQIAGALLATALAPWLFASPAEEAR
jgi:glycerol uptake facilitator-like aquaporin